jgi:predicted TPR repeat methyltransferase
MGGGSSPAGRTEPTQGRTPTAAFERLYEAEADPWGYATDAYEREKYERTLAALGERRFGRALEVGCSIGVFSASLADWCDHLVAIDPSATALARARERLRARANVELVQAAVPDAIPDGPFDLVVCSEVLYYLDRATLAAAVEGIEARLVSGGTLIAVHFRGRRGTGRVHALIGRRRRRPNPPAPLTGDEVHAFLRTEKRLALSHHEQHARYRLDRFDRA